MTKIEQQLFLAEELISLWQESVNDANAIIECNKASIVQITMKQSLECRKQEFEFLTWLYNDLESKLNYNPF